MLPRTAAPFVYVPDSHLTTPARRGWKLHRSRKAADEDRLTGRGSFRIVSNELEALGYPLPKSFPVARNTLIVANTPGFPARRLIAVPSLRPEIWDHLRASPFVALPIDPWRNPALGQRRATAFGVTVTCWNALASSRRRDDEGKTARLTIRIRNSRYCIRVELKTGRPYASQPCLILC